MRRWVLPVLAFLLLLAVLGALGWPETEDELARGFRNPPPEARPHAYWLWLNGYVHPESAKAELEAMKEAGFGGVLLFDMGARGDRAVQPPAGPAFLSDPWLKQFRESIDQARQLGLQVDFSVVSSWDMGGHWIEPQYASMGLYSTETEVPGGKAVELTLPFPAAPAGAPKGADGRPAFWTDVAVLAVRDLQRRPGHEFIFRLDPEGVHSLREAILDNGNPQPPASSASAMTPTRDFSIAVSTAGLRDSDFVEVTRGALQASPGPQSFVFPDGTKGSLVRLRLLSGHDPNRPHWTLGEFAVLDQSGVNLAAARIADKSRSGARLVRSSPPLGHDSHWNLENLHDGETVGPGAVFASAGLPPFAVTGTEDVVDLTALLDGEDRLRWAAPAGRWTIIRYVCMNTGERLKVPSPASDGWATDHLNPEATRAHMDYVIGRLRETFGDVGKSGLTHLYLASYEVRGPLWSPGFTKEFQRRRGYDMTPWLPALFGAQIGSDEITDRFLFDYRKTLGEVLIDAYYVAARKAAHQAGLTIKSEAGGPGPPVHNVPVDSLLANSAVDGIQGEFWPFWPDADAMWVVKETAAAGHIYGKPLVHMEAFTSFEAWREGPQDLKPSADRVFCEGGNHMVWHTWSHVSPEAGVPGWAYLAGTHINQNVTWWSKVRPFIDYLSRSSYLLQRGLFVADVLYYYGDGGYKFVGPRRNEASLGPGYDYDVTNSDVLLNRLEVRDGRLVLPDGTSYAVLVLPPDEDAHPAVLKKIERMVAAGATVVGSRPIRAAGLEGYPESDHRVGELAEKLWGDLDGVQERQRSHGKGRLIQGMPLRDVLTGMGIQPDFMAPNSLDFIHRKDGEADIYFVRNTRPEAVRADVSFRISNRVPEFWNPVSGEIAPAPVYRAAAERMEVPVALAPHGSIFVVFRKPVTSATIVSVSEGAEMVIRNGRTVLQTDKDGGYGIEYSDGKQASVDVSGLPAPMVLDGDWAVEFEKDRGAPVSLVFPELVSWARHSDPGVRFFSGKGRYRKTFNLPLNWLMDGQRVRLDLGRLWTLGEAWLNGKPLGVLWAEPFRVDCTEALQEGVNELIVEVTNTWYNRLAGDALLLPEERITRTNVTTSGGQPWAKLQPLDSGLMGPVRLVPIAERSVDRGDGATGRR
jgi:hypothetical protein